MVEGEGEQSLHLFDASMVSVFRERREGGKKAGGGGGVVCSLTSFVSLCCVVVLYEYSFFFVEPGEIYRADGDTGSTYPHSTSSTQESATRAERAITSLRQELLLE